MLALIDILSTDVTGVNAVIESMQIFLKGKPKYQGHQRYLNDRIPSLPELLSDAVYHTLMAGNWYLSLAPDRLLWRRGFNRSFALLPVCTTHELLDYR